MAASLLAQKEMWPEAGFFGAWLVFWATMWIIQEVHGE